VSNFGYRTFQYLGGIAEFLIHVIATFSFSGKDELSVQIV
jgi:hypothetical protein